MARRLTVEQFERRLRELPAELEQATIEGTRDAAGVLAGMVTDAIMDTRPYPPVDTGQLAGSVTVSHRVNSSTVSVDAPHAAHMEYGTRPHRPPIDALVRWALRKGLADSEQEAYRVAQAVADKIARRGLEPRFFVRRALAEFERRRILKRAIKRRLEVLS